MENALSGVVYEMSAVAEVLQRLDVANYLDGVKSEDLLKLMF